MKVAYYIGSLNQGGAEALLLDICRNKNAAPYEMMCIHRKKGVLYDDLLKTKVPLIQILCKRNVAGHILKLRRYLKQERVDVVHAQTSLCALYAILATIGTKIKVVTSFHGLGFNKANRIYQKIVFLGSSQLVFVSRQTQEIFLKDCPQINDKKCNVVYNGISFEKFALRNKDIVPSEILRIGMVGSFRTARNQMFVCQFLKRLKEEGVSFHFDFVGPRCKGEEACYDDCVQFCKANGLDEYVSFLGARKDVPDILNQWDAYIYATHFDTFGISVVEAISAGIPVFVNDWAVANEVTKDGECAIIYRSGDIDDLWNKFELFLLNRKEYEENAVKSAVEIRNMFSIEQHIENISRIYNKCI